MTVTVRIPTPLLSLTKGKKEVTAEGSTLREVIDDLERQFPGMKKRLCDEEGSLRRFINFFINDEDVRFLEGESTPLKEGDVLSIVPAIAGGV